MGNRCCKYKRSLAEKALVEIQEKRYLPRAKSKYFQPPATNGVKRMAIHYSKNKGKVRMVEQEWDVMEYMSESSGIKRLMEARSNEAVHTKNSLRRMMSSQKSINRSEAVRIDAN
eukprot:TRINITY_DN4186_c0_g1_i13.p1 TRINITY_DN4186_c0_g1~~TRINITY_DN4186_c0_g1_i13.p1  ORF type:complete len:115 (-),score=39.58 TRINITY_DN4186_c0_g1_i13:129-473(-)